MQPGVDFCNGFSGGSGKDKPALSGASEKRPFCWQRRSPVGLSRRVIEPGSSVRAGHAMWFWNH
jgi:hypothetical protein